MVQVIWSREAISNLDLIREYIQQFDPQAAKLFVARLIEAGESLQQFPERGRRSTLGKRELTIVAPYIIRYQYDGQAVRILSIRHSKQRG